MAEATRDDAARARLQGKRAVLGVLLVVSLAIIASSSWQIIPAVFGAGIRPIPAAPPGSSARTCAQGIRAARPGARPRAGGCRGEAPSSAPACSPSGRDEADDPRRLRASPREGLDAWAALARLRSAEEQLSGHAGDELEPLRRDVIAHLPADLR